MVVGSLLLLGYKLICSVIQQMTEHQLCVRCNFEEAGFLKWERGPVNPLKFHARFHACADFS